MLVQHLEPSHIGAMNEPAVRVENLIKRYPTAVAVDGISFTVARGVTAALLGGNGAGKTTTLSILLGLLLPSAGKVQVTTPAGNTLGRIVLVRPDQWKSRWKRRQQTEVTYYPYADVTQVVAHMRWGLAYMDSDSVAVAWRRAARMRRNSAPTRPARIGAPAWKQTRTSCRMPARLHARRARRAASSADTV